MISRLCGILLVSLVLMTCSAMDLTGDLQPQLCDEATSDLCESLNDLQPTNDECLRWACDCETLACVQREPDMDRDCAPAPGCGVAVEDEDCDDNDPTRAPTLSEVCDATDNDCDEIIDEGVLVFEATAPPEGFRPTEVFDVSASLSSSGDELLLLGAGGSLANVGSGGTVNLSGAIGVNFTPLVFNGVDGVTGNVTIGDIASLSFASQESRFAVFSTTFAGCGAERLVAGPIRVQETEVQVLFSTSGTGTSPDFFDNGFPDDSGYTCDADERDATYQVSNLAAGASENEMLIAFTQATTDSRSICTSDSTTLPPEAPLYLHHARADGNTLVNGQAQAFRLTHDSTDHAPPAIISIKTESGNPQWMVAHSGGSGSIRLHLVTREYAGAVVTLTSTELFDIRNPAGHPQGEVSLARGATNDDGTIEVALAFRRGCQGSAIVVAQLFRFDPSNGSLSELGEAFEVDDSGDSRDQRRPAIRYWPSRDSWFLAYQRGPRDIVGRRIDRTGGFVTDDSFDELLTLDNASATVVERAAFLDDGTDFAIVGYLPDSEEPGFWSSTLSCSSDTL